jgi:hypothetical protein
VVNNDPSKRCHPAALRHVRQAAVRPQGGNEARGVFAISSPFGDDFPIMFNPAAIAFRCPAILHQGD